MSFQNSFNKYIISLFLLIINQTAFAQKWELGAGIGAMSYKGDIMPTYKPLVVRPGGNMFLRMNISRAVSVKAQGIYGSIIGNDKFIKSDPMNQSRQYSFRASIMEGSGQIEYNFLNFRTNESRIVKNWTPYVFAGYAYYESKTNSLKKTVFIPAPPAPPVPTVVYTPLLTVKSERAMILGIGFKKQWNQNWNWGIEFGARHTTTDKLDDLGYEDDGSLLTNVATLPLSNPPLAHELLRIKYQMPPTRVNDIYYYTNFSISYLFYKVHCPNPRK